MNYKDQRKKTSDPAGGRPDHFLVEKPTFTQRLMVFCGIKRDRTFSLRIYRNKTMTGPSYHALLQHRVFPELRNWTQDRASPHCTLTNMRYLDCQFGDCMVSRKFISPNLKPLDFFLWGYLKSRVYSPCPSTLAQLKRNIQREVAALDPNMVLRALRDVKVRCHQVIANNGGHIEG